MRSEITSLFFLFLLFVLFSFVVELLFSCPVLEISVLLNFLGVWILYIFTNYAKTFKDTMTVHWRSSDLYKTGKEETATEIFLFMKTRVFYSAGTPICGGWRHTPSIAFRHLPVKQWDLHMHLPPNSARFSYATEGVLFIPAQLSTDAASALRKVRVLI